jgi:two-component system sensor histidine kinase KdpD
MLTPDERRLFDALSDQAAIAIERVHLVEDMDRAARTIETERLRSALLTSLSHDLKTPLASVLGSAETLKTYASKLSETEKADLLQTIIEEAERLNRFIANLLDMTRIEAGAIAPATSLGDLAEVVGGALNRATRILSGHHVALDIAKDLPLVRIDPVLLEQAIFNLLDNAAKYAPNGTTVTLSAKRSGDRVVLAVLDEGDGLAEADITRVFDKFYRARKEDHVRAGTGLGLAIARGFVETMGGTITAGNRTDRRGAVFTIALPVPSEPARLVSAA